MNKELIIENYDTEDFRDFYQKNKERIQKALKGRRMRKRHLHHAKKLLMPVLEIPEEMHAELIVDAIRETVDHAEEDGFEGSEFDHFGFAKRLRQKVQNVTKKTIDRKIVNKLRSKLQKKKNQGPKMQPVSQPPKPSESQIAPTGNDSLSEVFQSNARSTTPLNTARITAPMVSGGGGSFIQQEEEEIQETVESPAVNHSEAGSSMLQEQSFANSNGMENKGRPETTNLETTPDKKQESVDLKKWMLIGGGAIGFMVAIAVTVYLVKRSSNQ